MKTFSRRQFNRLSSAALLGAPFFSTFTGTEFLKNKLKIGQIGTAHSHAASKMATLRRLSNIFEIVGIVEPNKKLQNIARTKTEYQGLNWLTEQQLFEIAGIQAIAIETELDQLVPTSLRCIDAGLHVHIDKPPGKSLPEFKNLLDQAKLKGLVVQMGYMFRYNPAFQFCLKAVRKGWLGEIFEVDGVISKTISSERRIKLAKTYGGGMMLLGGHLIDILIAIMGKPGKITSFRRQTLRRQDELYDNELAIFEYARAVATIRSALIEVDGNQRRHFVVCGDKGTIEIKPLEPPQLRMTLREPIDSYQEGWQTIKLPPMQGRYDDQLIDFAQLIRKEKTADFSMEYDLIVHEALLKVCGYI